MSLQTEDSKIEKKPFNWENVEQTYNLLDELLIKYHDEKKLTYAEMLIANILVQLHIYQEYINDILQVEIEGRLTNFIEKKLDKILRGIQEDNKNKGKDLGMIG